MARTQAPISQLPSKRWQVRFRDLEGKQRKKTFDKHADAKEFYATTKAAVDRGSYVSAERGREGFVDYANRWAAAQDWKHSTREGFPSHLKRIAVHFGGLRLDQIDTIALQQLRGALMGQYATSTATITFHYATAIMKAAHDDGLIVRDVAGKIKPPKKRAGDTDGTVTAEEVPTSTEVRRLIASAPPPFRAFVALGACGLRIGEVAGVTLDRLDLEAGRLVVDRQLQRQDGQTVFETLKTEEPRTIDLPGWAVDRLRTHLDEHGPFYSLHGHPVTEPLLFRGARGSGLHRKVVYKSAWKPALRTAGLPEGRYRFHSLRHWCASSMLSHPLGSLPAVAAHLGDTVETVTRTYVHWLRDQDGHAGSLLDDMLPTGTEKALNHDAAPIPVVPLTT